MAMVSAGVANGGVLMRPYLTATTRGPNLEVLDQTEPSVFSTPMTGANAAELRDMMINVVREKQQTNIRTHSADEAVKLVPPKIHTLESAIEFIAEDELVEVTPSSIRIRKRILKESDRRRLKR